MTRELLVRLPLVFQPTCDMPAIRVVVGPVNDTALRVPFVLAKKFYRVPCSQGIDSRSQVNVMTDQNCLAGVELQNEPLMP